MCPNAASASPRPAGPEAGAKMPPRERILAVAREQFYRHGIRAVGVETIAEAAGTNKMTLYRHFASKDELVAACLRQSAAEEDAVWACIAGAHPGDPRAQLLAWAQRMGQSLSAPEARGCALANAAVELPEPDHPARAVIEEHKCHQRDQVVRLCREAGLADPELVASGIFLMLEGARVDRQSAGAHGVACRFVTLVERLIAAHAR